MHSEGESESPKQRSSTCDCFQKKLVSAGLVSQMSPPTFGKYQPTWFLKVFTAARLHFCFSVYGRERFRKKPPCDKHVQAMEMSHQTSPCPSRHRFPGCIISASCNLVPAMKRALLQLTPVPSAGSRTCTHQFAHSTRQTPLRAACETAGGL